MAIAVETGSGQLVPVLADGAFTARPWKYRDGDVENPWLASSQR